MLYLDYAKSLADGKYILSFFADNVADLESISHGQKFVTKNGTDYGVPQPGSTVIVISPNSEKTTYVMDAEGIWVVTEDISYSAVVANPIDAATAKLEKLKVNDTTYANWTPEEIKAMAGGNGGKYYRHQLFFGLDPKTENIKPMDCYINYYSKDQKAYSSMDELPRSFGLTTYFATFETGRAPDVGMGYASFGNLENGDSGYEVGARAIFISISDGSIYSSTNGGYEYTYSVWRFMDMGQTEI